VNGTVYTGCRDSNLYALDAATGKEKWRVFNDLSWVITSPSVADGRVFFATSDSSLYHVVDANSGKPIVCQQGKAYMFPSPAVAGDVVFIGVLNGTLEARDAKTGELLLGFSDGEVQAKQRLGAYRRSKVQCALSLPCQLA
jgi:outer membrane protein assembly factor BamB